MLEEMLLGDEGVEGGQELFTRHFRASVAGGPPPT